MQLVKYRLPMKTKIIYIFFTCNNLYSYISRDFKPLPVEPKNLLQKATVEIIAYSLKHVGLAG